ncbi:MAG TPA: SAM-dependent chlorinase/fluorinase [Anaerolineales bacterium]|nr:SAM-dependent chlorinase/fluorinase [Anaerolineales bacterium]
MQRSNFITLLTDFGLKDGNVGVMKGVIWGLAPQVKIADISHQVSPQNVPEAALILRRSAPYFPRGAIHVIVVDPGVGTSRRPIAARIGPHYYICPDNGILTMMLARAEAENWPVQIVHADKPRYWLPEVSHVFHGRDIFAPLAAHLANGVPLQDLGAPVGDPIRLKLPLPKRTEHGWVGEVIHIDHFGNLSSNIRQEHLGNPANLQVHLCGFTIHGLVRTFGERPPGELVALYGSTGNLIVSVVNGSAAQRLGTRPGDPLEVRVRP